jgi:hypothetical protein
MKRSAEVKESTAESGAWRSNARKRLAELLSKGNLSSSTRELTGDWNAHKSLWVLVMCVRALRSELIEWCESSQKTPTAH